MSFCYFLWDGIGGNWHRGDSNDALNPKNIGFTILEIFGIKTSIGTLCPALLQAQVSLLRSLAHNSKTKREREN